jgi:hypothetical protein
MLEGGASVVEVEDELKKDKFSDLTFKLSKIRKIYEKQ